MIHDWIRNQEAIWLFYILAAELIIGLYTAVILTVEYFWGRSDTDIKREVVRKKAARAKQKAEDTQTLVTTGAPNVK